MRLIRNRTMLWANTLIIVSVFLDKHILQKWVWWEPNSITFLDDFSAFFPLLEIWWCRYRQEIWGERVGYIYMCVYTNICIHIFCTYMVRVQSLQLKIPPKVTNSSTVLPICVSQKIACRREGSVIRLSVFVVSDEGCWYNFLLKNHFLGWTIIPALYVWGLPQC